MRSLFTLSLMFVIWFAPSINCECSENLAWECISKEIIEVNIAWIDNQNPRIILIGTNRGVFRTEDAGNSWQAVLFGANKSVNFLFVDQINKKLIYAACSSGLFFSRNQGKNWQRIYQGSSELESNCLSIIKLNDKEIYLGTEAGLLKSQDNGRIWHRFPGKLGYLPIQVITADWVTEHVYLVTKEGAFKINPEGGVKKIFVFQSNDLEEVDEGIDEEVDAESSHKINHICIDSQKPQDIYLATAQGAFISKDKGITWSKLSDFGLLSKQVRFIIVTADSIVLAATKSGIFVYNKEKWQELSLGLTVQDIRFLTIGHLGNIYVAGDKGLFKSVGFLESITYSQIKINYEPTVRQVQQAAIKYAQVVDPKQIATHRRLARLKAILPEFSLDYDKTISTYNNSQLTRFAVGPQDWGISLRWSLSDFIWSEQQRLIDSQVRLMVKLRQDIMDEVTRLFFERRRIQLELNSSQELMPKEQQDKELKMKELTALLDGLTGGFLSKLGLTE